MRIPEAVKIMKDKIIKATENNPDKWMFITINTIQSELKCSYYTAYNVNSMLKVDPDIRNRVAKVSSRYATREYRVGNLEDKIKDLYSSKHTDMTDEAESYIISTLKDKYCNKNDIIDLYKMIYICEKMTNQELHKYWRKPDKDYIIRGLGMTSLEFDEIIEKLLKEEILIESPHHLGYMLALSEEDKERIHRKITEYNISSNLEVSEESKNFDDNITENTFSELSELNTLLENYKTLRTHLIKLVKTVDSSESIFDDLALRHKALKQSKIVFKRLNESNHDLQEKNEILTKENHELKMKLKAYDNFFPKYKEHVDSELDSLTSVLVSSVDDFGKLALYEKSNPQRIAKTKSEMIKEIVKTTESIKNYKAER